MRVTWFCSYKWIEVRCAPCSVNTYNCWTTDCKQLHRNVPIKYHWSHRGKLFIIVLLIYLLFIGNSKNYENGLSRFILYDSHYFNDYKFIISPNKICNESPSNNKHWQAGVNFVNKTCPRLWGYISEPVIGGFG